MGQGLATTHHTRRVSVGRLNTALITLWAYLICSTLWILHTEDGMAWDTGHGNGFHLTKLETPCHNVPSMR